MVDGYTFMVTSTVNTHDSAFNNAQRFTQTLATLDSIRTQVPGAKTIICDNSTVPLSLEQVAEIESRADFVLPFQHNLATLFFNSNPVPLKGFGDVYTVYELMRAVRELNWIGSRVFKISGRYRLATTFDIDEYADCIGKYVGLINDWDYCPNPWTRERITYFETRLYSFCGSLFDEYWELLPKIFTHMSTVDKNLEKTHYTLLPRGKIHRFNTLHLEGYSSDTGVIKQE
jgi:hypothetical protein